MQFKHKKFSGITKVRLDMTTYGVQFFYTSSSMRGNLHING